MRGTHCQRQEAMCLEPSMSSFLLTRRIVPWAAAVGLALVAGACAPADQTDETSEESGQTGEDIDQTVQDIDGESGQSETDGSAQSDDPANDASDQASEAEPDVAVATEPLEVEADGITLEGTTFLPETEPLGGVVIAHGSGPFSRTGEMPGQLGLMLPESVQVYTELAEAFAEAGYVVATFDKRTCGSFNDCSDNGYPAPDDDLTFDVMVEDANAVVDAIAARDDVDEVAVVGHSKGGTVAAHLAGNDSISAVALLGAPVQPIYEILRMQAAKLWELSEGTADEPSAMTQVMSLNATADAVEAAADGDVSGDDIGGTSRQFWASWVDASNEAPDLLNDAEVAALAVGGTIDWNVPASEVEAWADVVDDIEVVILDGMAHTLTHVDEEDADEIDAVDLDVHVDQAVPDAIVDFLADSS